ncbi:MAG: hypothetical protein ABIW79_11040 [Gemmatimonas sp.]
MGIDHASGSVLSGSKLAHRAQAFRASATQGTELLDETRKLAARYYRWRNRLLLIGFVLLVAARVLPAYAR